MSQNPRSKNVISVTLFWSKQVKEQAQTQGEWEMGGGSSIVTLQKEQARRKG